MLKKIALVSAVLALILLFASDARADFATSSVATTTNIVLGGGGNKVSWDTATNTATGAFAEDPIINLTNLLKANNFGFTVPANAIIDGVEVSLTKQSNEDSDDNFTQDLAINLNRADDTVGSENKADTATHWSADGAIATYGAQHDLWGEILTPDEVNNPNFGVNIRAQLTSTTLNVVAQIKSFTITVYYSLPVLTTINLTPADMNLTTGTTGQLSAETLDQFGAPIPAVLTWSSDNEGVATVDSAGLVTAVAPGAANITASEDTVTSAVVGITVTAPVKKHHSGGGGGGGGGTTLVSSATTAPEPVGQVLGAEKFIFTLFLKQGSFGNEVMELQKFLNASGYGTLVLDGKFGPKTNAAVIKFQIANGLVGDGLVGPKTRAVLNK